MDEPVLMPMPREGKLCLTGYTLEYLRRKAGKAGLDRVSLEFREGEEPVSLVAVNEKDRYPQWYEIGAVSSAGTAASIKAIEWERERDGTRAAGIVTLYADAEPFPTFRFDGNLIGCWPKAGRIAVGEAMEVYED